MRRPVPPDVRVYPDLRVMSRAAADFILVLVRRIVDETGRCSLVLSGGTTPKRLYTLFASAPYREAFPWPKMHIFWADERCVPPDQPESNFKLALDTFLKDVSLPAANVHRIQGEAECDRAALGYEKDLLTLFGPDELPRFDVVLLGAGDDGHTASLFPGSVQMRERKRLAVPVFLEPPKLSRVSLTLPVLNNASNVIYLAAGRAKAGVVHEIIEDGNPKDYPAGLIQPAQGNLIWMLDSEAASALTGVLMHKS